MRLWKASILVIALTFTVYARAETPDSNLSASAAPAAPSTVSTFYGRLEMRPTLQTATGLMDSQNQAEVGYSFTANTKLLFNQGFNFDLRNPTSSGVNFLLPDARIELDLNNVFADRRTGWSLDYQPRLHVPTDNGKRDLGLITEFRHQFNLNKQFSDSFTLVTSLIPAVHAYSNRGGKDATGAMVATPYFENRLEVMGRWNFARNWKVEVPLKFWQTRYHNFAVMAAHNDMWAFSVTMKPEIQWAFDPHMTVGFAFETASFFTEDFKKATFGDAFRNAKAQIALIATI